MCTFKAQICLFNNFITILQDGKKRKFPTGKTIFSHSGKNDLFPFLFFPVMGKNSLSRYGKKQPFPAISSFPFPVTVFPFPLSRCLLFLMFTRSSRSTLFQVLLSQLSPSHYSVKTLELSAL